MRTVTHFLLTAIYSVITVSFVLTSIPAYGQSTSDLTIGVNPSDTSSWTVDEKIYGKFIEHNGKDIYPGLYSQHLANSSFENWYHKGDKIWRVRTAILYRDTPQYDDLPYPWEPQINGAATTTQLGDGIHANRYLRIQVSGGSSGGIRQRTALPAQRTQVYQLHYFARGTIDSATIRFESLQGDIISSKTVAVDTDSATWTKDTLSLDTKGTFTGRYQGSKFWEYALGIVIEGDGNLDIDGLRLMSGDAVQGKYNPTTINLLQEFNVTSIRWPGGNWASAYHWKDGVGPIKERPVRRNLAWGGLEANFMGTNEFLEFCEIAGITPYLNVGFNPTIGPEEAADWVEYVNGSKNTEMGQLRAKHGHPEPYNVKHWQVGNEVYGPYQIGHTNATDFAERFVDYYKAMKAVDPDIRVVAAGIDPLYTNYDQDWNRTVFSIAGDSLDGIDTHRYLKGVFSDDIRQNWDQETYMRNMVSFPTVYEQHVIDVMKTGAAAYGRPDMRINVGEWNLQARVNSNWPRPNYPTMAHASFVAGMFNVFIRNGEAIQYSYQRDNTLFYRPFPIDMRPVNPGNYVSKFYAEPFTGSKSWHHLTVSNSSPTFFWEKTGFRTRDTKDVPYVDATAIRSSDGSTVHIFLTNRSVQFSFNANIKLDQNWKATNDPSLKYVFSSDPFNRQTSWTNRNGFSINSYSKSFDTENKMQVSLDPASVLRISMNIEKNSTSITSDHPQHPDKVILNSNYPNPFNPETTIPYALPEAAHVTLEIYNAIGQRVETLVDTYKNAGRYKTSWNAGNHSSGIYYYKLTTKNITRVETMMLIK